MILLGCLLAFSAAIAPRLVLILAWIFSDRWAKVWEGEFLLPLAGIIFLPYTTIMYMLTVTVLPGGGTMSLEGWDWMWIILGLFLDVMKWGQMLANRKEAQTQTQKYYPSGAPRNTGAAAAAVSSGSMPPSTSPTAPDADTSPTAVEAPPPAAEAPADDAAGSDESNSGSSGG